MSNNSISNRRNGVTIPIVNKIISDVESYVGDVESMSEFTRNFNTLSQEDKLELIEDIIDFQTLHIIESMKERKDVTIPVMGSFIIKENKLLIMNLMNEVANEKGYTNFEEAPKEVRDIIRRGLSENIPEEDDEEGISLRNRRIEMFRRNKLKKKNNV